MNNVHLDPRFNIICKNLNCKHGVILKQFINHIRVKHKIAAYTKRNLQEFMNF